MLRETHQHVGRDWPQEADSVTTHVEALWAGAGNGLLTHRDTRVMKEWQIQTLIGIGGGLLVGVFVLVVSALDGGGLPLPGK